MSFSSVNVPDYQQQSQEFYNQTNTIEFSQMFGEDEDSDDDGYGSPDTDNNIITSMAFDATGHYLAIGYISGQVVILAQQNLDTMYQFLADFRSHDSAFDCLTSVEIEPKINMLRWYPFNTPRVQHILTTNDKTIKLFKMSNNGGVVSTKQRKIYDSGHTYNINSVSFNSDGETFISSDDLRVNLWNIEVGKEVFEIVDIKPDNMDELSEIITSCVFHPKNCNIFSYSTSKGVVRVGDLRNKALCQSYAKEFEDIDSDVGGFFRELISNVSDVKFSPDGQFIASREYLSVKIWDSRNEKKPLRVIQFQDHLIPKLCDLYENNCIFDKFECCWSNNSLRILTGSYNNNFYLCDVLSNNPKISYVTAAKPNTNTGISLGNRIQYTKKVTHTAYHPNQDIIAIGARDFGYIYVIKHENTMIN